MPPIIVPPIAKSDGSDALAATLTATPPAADATRTGEPERATPSAPAEDAPSLAAQHRDPERYRILGEHGRGGLGRVSRAHDRDLGRDVAIKELISRGHVSEIRFLREALITARLEHPGIVPVHEAGRWPDGTPFYAMKLVAGRSLRDLLAERKTADQRIALLHHVIAVADAIAYAHGKHIIHRDLKPANVIVGDFGETVVIDWGLAKDLTQPDESSAGGGPFRASRNDDLTSAGTVLGTPAYMAPEQERGEPVDPRADVFAIGAMLWELCTLQKLPPGDRGQRRRILRRAGIDSDLVAIIDKAVDPDRARRYPDAGALAADLKAFKAGARIAARHYSLLAMLAHWTRRHRALAASLGGAVAIAAAVAVLYVRNIAIERDRADVARAEAERERRAAATERDRAQLSEAAMWLEKDPTHARDLLRSAASQDAQRALLLAEAEGRSAARVLDLGSRVQEMRGAGPPFEVAVVTVDGELIDLDLDAGAPRVVDHELTGPIVRRGGHWCYALVPAGTDSTVVSGCGAVAPLGTLLRRPSSQLAWAGGALYALEAGELYRLEPTRPVRVARRIRAFAGSDTFAMTCTEDGQLQITRDGKLVATSRCASNSSESTVAMATRGEHYVALRSPTELISERGIASLPVAVKGEYALALGEDGLIALSDFSGEAWVVRPGSLHPEAVAQHPARPRGVAADASLVAFGYSDGAVIVVDTASGRRWEFAGHADAVMRVVIDAGRRRVLSSAGNEIRIWDLRPTAVAAASALPCTPFHLVPTHDPRSLAADCDDGRAFVWAPGTDRIRTLHEHRDLAYGVVMHHEDVCTGGWDGRVLCTPMAGGDTKEMLANAERVKSIASCGDRLFAATADGAIWQVDHDAHVLYKHHATPYRIATDASCTRLASGDYDGSLVIYDIPDHRIEVRSARAHEGQITSLVFRDEDLFTSGIDANVRRWRAGDRLELVASTRLSGPATKLHVFSDGWAAVVDERTLVMHSTSSGSEIRLAVNRPIADIAMSPDERYAAISDLSEVVVIDRERASIAATYSPASDIGCLRFAAPATLAACDRSAILSISLASLTFFQQTSR